MATVKVWRNKTKHCWYGRPQHFSRKIPIASCPPLRNGTGGGVNKTMLLGPGDEYQDDQGRFDMVQNAGNHFTILCYGTKEEVEKEMTELDIPKEAIVDQLCFVDGDKVGRVFIGAQYVLHDATDEFRGAIDRTTNRLASMKEVSSLLDSNAEKDAIIQALNEKLAAATRSGEKQVAQQARVEARTGR